MKSRFYVFPFFVKSRISVEKSDDQIQNLLNIVSQFYLSYFDFTLHHFIIQYRKIEISLYVYMYSILFLVPLITMNISITDFPPLPDIDDPGTMLIDLFQGLDLPPTAIIKFQIGPNFLHFLVSVQTLSLEVDDVFQGRLAIRGAVLEVGDAVAD